MLLEEFRHRVAEALQGALTGGLVIFGDEPDDKAKEEETDNRRWGVGIPQRAEPVRNMPQVSRGTEDIRHGDEGEDGDPALDARAFSANRPTEEAEEDKHHEDRNQHERDVRQR